MKILLIGATGMLGQGVLRECLLNNDVELVQTVGRTSVGQTHAKLSDVVQNNIADCAAIENQLQGFDACFFCLGVSSSGLTEAEYAHLTYDLTLGFAKTLLRINPQITFVYVSGAGTDSSEQGSIMWARVKGKTENHLRALGFKAVYLFRPGIIQPLYGASSKTKSYRIFYTITSPLLPLLRKLFPRFILSTDIIAQAMLSVTKHNPELAIMEAVDIYSAAKNL